MLLGCVTIRNFVVAEPFGFCRTKLRVLRDQLIEYLLLRKRGGVDEAYHYVSKGFVVIEEMLDF